MDDLSSTSDPPRSTRSDSIPSPPGEVLFSQVNVSHFTLFPLICHNSSFPYITGCVPVCHISHFSYRNLYKYITAFFFLQIAAALSALARDDRLDTLTMQNLSNLAWRRKKETKHCTLPSFAHMPILEYPPFFPYVLPAPSSQSDKNQGASSLTHPFI